VTTKRTVDVVPGDRVRLASGRELHVTRIERDFLGYDNLICFVEDTDECWFAHAMSVTDEVVTVSQVAPDRTRPE
jgi:hypothetical protein